MQTVVFVTRLTPSTQDGLRLRAAENGRTMSGEARVILEDALGIDRLAYRIAPEVRNGREFQPRHKLRKGRLNENAP